jgi:hypothetical protein
VFRPKLINCKNHSGPKTGILVLRFRGARISFYNFTKLKEKTMSIIKRTIICAVGILVVFVSQEAYCQTMVPMITSGNVAIYYPQAPVAYYQPLVSTGYYAVPVTTYQYVPYQYVSGGVWVYPVNWTNVNIQPVIVESRGCCFGARNYLYQYR